MKRFNWVIDLKNRQVFIKPVAVSAYNPKEIDIEAQKYGASIVRENLQLIFRQKNDTTFPLFKNVISVSDTVVPSENIIRFVNYPNNIKSWKDVQLKSD